MAAKSYRPGSSKPGDKPEPPTPPRTRPAGSYPKSQPVLLLRGSSGTAQVLGNPPQIHVDFHGELYETSNKHDGSFVVICNLNPDHAVDIGELGHGVFEDKLHGTSGTWTFGYGDDVIIAEGYAGISLKPLRLGGKEMWFADTMTITDGSGKYQGAAGQVNSLGWAQVEDLPPPGSSFTFEMIHVISVLPRIAVGPEEEE
jgi:hypothetical protein